MCVLDSVNPILKQICVKGAIGVHHMLVTSKVIYQGQGSSKVKLGGKCKICIFFFFFLLKSWSPITTKLDLEMQHVIVNRLLSEWVGLSLT